MKIGTRNLIYATLCLLILQISIVSSLYSSTSAVKVISVDKLNELKNKHGVVIVEFFADWCGHCKAFAPEFEKAAQAMRDVVPIVAIDDQSAMGTFGVQGFPTIKIFSTDFTKPRDYSGPRTAQGVVNAALAAIKEVANGRLSGKGKSSSEKGKSGGEKSSGKSEKKKSKSMVVELTDANFEKEVMSDDGVWFIKFYAPWCGHCKSLAPDWSKLSADVAGKIKIGQVDATKETILAGRYQVKGFPTLLLFPPGKKNDVSAIPYNGPRSSQDMLEFAMQYFSSNAKAEQLVSDDQFRQNCNTRLCVVAFLPHLADSKVSGRDEYLSILNDVVKSSLSMPVNFFWIEGGAQFEFEEKLRLAFGYPAVVAITVEKGMFSTHRGSFDVRGLKSFLTALMAGKSPVDPLPSTFNLKTTEKWDGGEYVESSDEL